MARYCQFEGLNSISIFFKDTSLLEKLPDRLRCHKMNIEASSYTIRAVRLRACACTRRPTCKCLHARVCAYFLLIIVICFINKKKITIFY